MHNQQVVLWHLQKNVSILENASQPSAELCFSIMMLVAQSAGLIALHWASSSTSHGFTAVPQPPDLLIWHAQRFHSHYEPTLDMELGQSRSEVTKFSGKEEAQIWTDWYTNLQDHRVLYANTPTNYWCRCMNQCLLYYKSSCDTSSNPTSTILSNTACQPYSRPQSDGMHAWLISRAFFQVQLWTNFRNIQSTTEL